MDIDTAWEVAREYMSGDDESRRLAGKEASDRAIMACRVIRQYLMEECPDELRAAEAEASRKAKQGG
jgi:hypothetical protein